MRSSRWKTLVRVKGSTPFCCPRRSSRVAARRKRVADAARDLFAAQGFENTQIVQISAAAGVQVGQIYRDFDSKEEIVADIVGGHLAEFLDEVGLEKAIVDRDPAAIRRWIGQLIRCGDATESRLFAQIVVEATRNERIALLLQHADRRVSCALGRAIGALAPKADDAARAQLVSIVTALMKVMPYRRIAAPDTDLTALAASLTALIERELDRLTTL
jgi:AcrR family transcriptional regulator